MQRSPGVLLGVGGKATSGDPPHMVYQHKKTTTHDDPSRWVTTHTTGHLVVGGG